ncbi:MAG: hypothetical protein AAF511_05610 [Pseudomonadota bacterium]
MTDTDHPSDQGPWLQRPWEAASPIQKPAPDHVPKMIKNHRPEPVLKPPKAVREAVDRSAFEKAWLGAQRDAARAQWRSFETIKTLRRGPRQSRGPEPQ